ncbi:MAG: hypothetical protein ABIT04_01020 [Novosphingobium sp.]
MTAPTESASVPGEDVAPPVSRPQETPEQRKARIQTAIESMRGSIELDGMTTDEYMRRLRGDWEP